MEICSTTTESVSFAGDNAHIPDDAFTKLVKCACQGVLLEEYRNVLEGRPKPKA